MGAFKCDLCIHKVVCQATVDGPCIEDCALYTKEENFNSAQQANTAIALAERYKLPFSSTSKIGSVMDGFIYWLQEQQQ